METKYVAKATNNGHVIWVVRLIIDQTRARVHGGGGGSVGGGGSNSDKGKSEVKTEKMP